MCMISINTNCFLIILNRLFKLTLIFMSVSLLLKILNAFIIIEYCIIWINSYSNIIIVDSFFKLT